MSVLYSDNINNIIYKILLRLKLFLYQLIITRIYLLMKKINTQLLLLFVLIATTLVGQNNQPSKESINDIIKAELNNDDLIENRYSRSLSKSFQSSTLSYGTPPDISSFSDFGGSASDYIRDITSDAQGYVYVTGSFSGELTIDGNEYTSVGDFDSFIAMFDSNDNGRLIWFKQIPSSKDNRCIPYAITLDDDGSIYITGTYTGSFKLGNKILPSTDNYNLFYAHFDNNGSIINSAYHSESENEIGLDIITDSDSNIYILASTSTNGDSRHQSWLLKFNNNATLISEVFYEVGFNELLINNQNLYFTGVISSGDDGYLNNGIVIPSPMSYNDVFIAKSDLSLNFEWVVAGAHPEKSNGDSMSSKLDIDDLGNIYIVGTYRDNLTLGDFSVEEGYGVSFVAKIDYEYGNVVWLKSFLSNKNHISVNDNIVSILKDKNILQNISLDGNSSSEKQFDSSFYDLEVVNGNLILWGRENTNIYLTQFSNSYVQKWKSYLAGTSSSSRNVGTVIDKEGNIYNCFTTSASIDYHGIQVNRGTILTKLDNKGNLIWLKQFPKMLMNNSIGNHIDIDLINSSLVLTDLFDEELQIPGGPNLYPLESGSIFISKFDLDGNHIWSKQENFSSANTTVDIDVNGNVYLSGTFGDEMYIGNTNFISKGYGDAFIAKYNSNGDFEWAKQIGGVENEYDIISTSDNDGYIYLTGEFLSEEVNFGETTFYMLEGDGNIFVAKINGDGDILWNKTIAGGPDYQDNSCWPTGIVSDNIDYIFIKGWLGNDNMFDEIKLTSDFYYNKFVTKIDNSDGSVIWANPIYETSFSIAYNSFSVDREGSVYLGSEVSGDQVFFDNDFTYSKVGNQDAFIAKYLGNGTLDWVKTIQSSSYLRISSVSNQDVDEVVVTGYFSGNLTFDQNSAESISTHSFISILESNKLAIEDTYNKKDKLVVYPNPTKGNVSINLNNLDYNKIEIINVSGVIIKSITKINSNGLYDLSNITKGLYILKVYSEDNSYSQQLIIE